MSLVALLDEKASVREIARQSDSIDFDVTNAMIEKDILFVKKDIGGLSGIQQLLKQSDAELDGVRNIDSAKLNGGEAFLVEKIIVTAGQAEHKCKTEEELRIVDLYTNLGNFPVELRSAKLSLKVNSTEKFSAPINRIANITECDDVFGQGKSGKEVPPFIIPANQVVLPEINLYDRVDDGDGDLSTVLEISFVGYRITKNI